MADSNVTSAATALEPMRKPGRPTGSGGIRTETVNFRIGAALDALIDIASQPPKGPWDWDASRYPMPGLSQRFYDMAGLNIYSQFLLVLIRLAPHGHPINEDSAGRLRDLLIQLHTHFNIFPDNSKVCRL